MDVDKARTRFAELRGQRDVNPADLLRANPSPTRDEIRGVRQALWIETALFALIPIAAAGMARGYGS